MSIRNQAVTSYVYITLYVLYECKLEVNDRANKRILYFRKTLMSAATILYIVGMKRGYTRSSRSCVIATRMSFAYR